MGETIESIFDEIGGFGLAQWIILIVIYYGFFGASWSMIQMAFTVKAPDWLCVENTPLQHQHEHLYSNSSELADVCSVNGSDCISFDFQDSERTAINEWSLVCSRKWVPSTMISIQMGGVLLGAVMAGQMSDLWGRRKSLVFATAWHTCANFMAFFSPNWQIFATCRFLAGFGIGEIFTITFPYAMEFLPPNRRGRVALFPFWTIGVAIFVGVACLMPHWRYLHLANAAFCLPSPIILFIIPESIRWLTVEGRLDEAMVAVEKMARWNGKPVPSNAKAILEMIFFKKRQDSKGSKKYSYLDIFKGAYFLKCSIIMCFIWASMSMISYGIGFGVHGLAGSLYLNILLTNCVEIPGLLPVLWLMDRFGRKWTSVISFSIIGITATVVLVIQVTGTERNEQAVFWFAMVTKLCIDNVWNVLQAWVIELYPTTMRSLAFGVATTGARVGGMLAPFLIDLKHRLVLTYVIILSLSSAVVILSFLLNETRLSDLKDSMGTKAHLPEVHGDEEGALNIEIKVANGHTNKKACLVNGRENEKDICNSV